MKRTIDCPHCGMKEIQDEEHDCDMKDEEEMCECGCGMRKEYDFTYATRGPIVPKDLTPKLEVMGLEDVQYFMEKLRKNPNDMKTMNQLLMVMATYVDYQRIRMEFNNESE